MRIMVIEDRFIINTKGLVVTGILCQNTKVGQKVVIATEERLHYTTIVGMEEFNKTLSDGKAGQMVGLLFNGLSDKCKECDGSGTVPCPEGGEPYICPGGCRRGRLYYMDITKGCMIYEDNREKEKTTWEI